MSECGISVEVIEKIESMALKAADTTPTVLPVPGRKNVNYLVAADGTTQEIMADCLLYRNIVLETPDQLMAFIGEDFREKEDPVNAVIFYDQSEIVYLRNEDEIRSRVTVPLLPGPQYQLLGKLSGMWLDQRQLVRTLRIELRGAINDNGATLQLVRNLRFTQNGNVEASIDHGAESMGKSIREAVTGAAALPEDLPVVIDVFENWRRPQRLNLAIDIDPTQARFQLAPYPLEMRAALDRTMEELGKYLNGAEVKAFRGRPARP
jgi:hypothetical protein